MFYGINPTKFIVSHMRLVFILRSNGDDEDNVENFPYEYGYLITYYAAIKALQNALSAKSLPSFTLPTAPVCAIA